MSLRGKLISSENSGAPPLRRFCGKDGIPRTITLLVLLSALPLWSQYTGQVAKSRKASSELRSIAVLEWTGDAGKPKTSRLVPVAVLDQRQVEGNQLQDGGLYLARPEPLAVAADVEYELQEGGKSIGLFDIKNAGQEQGSWVGYGAWKPLPVPKPKPSMDELARTHVDEADSDRPTLHRKHRGDESGGSSGSTEPASSPDPDRPTLHKKDTSSEGTSTGGSAAPEDPDRPVLKKDKKKPRKDVDEPRMKKGKGDRKGGKRGNRR